MISDSYSGTQTLHRPWLRIHVHEIGSFARFPGTLPHTRFRFQTKNIDSGQFGLLPSLNFSAFVGASSALFWKIIDRFQPSSLLAVQSFPVSQNSRLLSVSFALESTISVFVVSLKVSRAWRTSGVDREQCWSKV
jgi:hypothetical protein